MSHNGCGYEMERTSEMRQYPTRRKDDAGRIVANPLKPLYFIAVVSLRFSFLQYIL